MNDNTLARIACNGLSSSEPDLSESDLLLVPDLLLFRDKEHRSLRKAGRELGEEEIEEMTQWLLKAYKRPIRQLHEAIQDAHEIIRPQNDAYRQFTDLIDQIDNGFSQLLVEATRSNIDRRRIQSSAKVQD